MSRIFQASRSGRCFWLPRALVREGVGRAGSLGGELVRVLLLDERGEVVDVVQGEAPVEVAGHLLQRGDAEVERGDAHGQVPARIARGDRHLVGEDGIAVAERGVVGLAERAHPPVGTPVEGDAVPALLARRVAAVDGEDPPLHPRQPLQEAVGQHGRVDAGDPLAPERRAHRADPVVAPPLGEVAEAVEDAPDVAGGHQVLAGAVPQPPQVLRVVAEAGESNVVEQGFTPRGGRRAGAGRWGSSRSGGRCRP